MIILTATTDLIEVTYAAAAAPSLAVHASYVGQSAASGYVPGRSSVAPLTNTSGATSTILAGLASTFVTVKYCSVYNGGSTALAVQVKYTDGTNVIPLTPNITLGVGYTLAYMEGSDCWTVRDTSGNVLHAFGGSGRFLKRTYLTATATTAFVASIATNSITVRMVGGGGQGGGAPATTGENGSGGGAGAYLEWTGAVTPGASYNYNAGAGGSTSGTGATGQVGSSSVFTGPTTLTAPGGAGGIVGASITLPVAGGAGGLISTNGTLNVVGDAGDHSYCIGTAIDNASGKGGDSPLGSGGPSQLNISNATGVAASGYGAGGGGATTTGTARAGGAGAQGVIIIDEYS